MLNAGQIAAIKHHVEDAWPHEACGFITANGSIHPCINQAPPGARETTFAIAPRVAAEVAAKYGIAGLYHSHINRAARPSSKDLASLWVNKVHVIASVRNGLLHSMCAYTLVDYNKISNFTEVPLV